LSKNTQVDKLFGSLVCKNSHNWDKVLDSEYKKEYFINLVKFVNKIYQEETRLQKVDIDIENMQERIYEEYELTYNDCLNLKNIDENFDLKDTLIQINKIKNTHKAGETLVITVYRGGEITADVTVKVNGEEKKISAKGNGRLDAVSNAIKQQLGIHYSDLTYEEHALTKGSTSKAISYVSIADENGEHIWGAGINEDIIGSSIQALFSAVNRLKSK